ncbi:MAG: adenosylmethionine--8-amino-7-oxononanoate transaminase [Crocinitomicaceae bacterium]|nr:adenosylmethionine--8-amino-7-oxononanoate transaminase [Crocinitomicaceae bacterium]
MKTADPPVLVERAKDTLLYAADGRVFIDAISSWWVNLHGHAHPVIAEGISRQAMEMEHVIFAGFTHRPAVKFAELLTEMLGGDFSKVFFSDNGSTAVEVAVKMALQYWYNQGERKKTKLIAFENAYHGDTFGAMSVGAKSAFNAPFHSHLFEVSTIPVPDESNVGDIKIRIRNLASEGTIAAFIFEPLVQGSGGMLMHRPEYLDQLMSACSEENIFCIADEVMTGFGRTGKTFAIQYLRQQPDIICLSKGITGGFMPLGVTVSTEKIFDAFYDDDKTKALFHGHSYTANPLACAAAIANLHLLNGTECAEQIARIQKRHQIFAAEMQGMDGINDVRQTGTILALEMNNPGGYSYFSSVRDHLYRFALERGVLLRPLGNVLYTMPPYCITDTELDRVYDVMRNAAGEIKRIA